MSRCIIHIGHPKTATTYLQHCLHLNQSLFARHDYWIPGDFESFGLPDYGTLAREGKVIDGNLGPIHLMMSTPSHPQIDDMIYYLFAAPGMKTSSDIILSSELFFYYPYATADLTRFAKSHGHTPELVAYIPRQDKAAVSIYLQNVRNHGYTFGAVEFLEFTAERRYCRYFQLFALLTKLAPGVKLTVRTFEPQFLKNNDILTDFLATFDSRVSAAECARPGGSVNQGLNIESYELIRAATILDRPDIVARIRDQNIRLKGNDRSRLHGFYYRPPLRYFLQNNFIPTNKQMTASFMPHLTPEEKAHWTQIPLADAQPPIDLALFDTLRRQFFGH